MKNRFNYWAMVPFGLVHAACVAAVWTGVTWENLVLCAALYAARMFAVTAGYHRYFSHRTYRTSRAFQFLLAVAAQCSAQRGILWWAAKHREHHKFSDTPQDVHSPRQKGFWYSHVGWIFERDAERVDAPSIRDLSRFPELRWLDRHPYLPAAMLGTLVWWIGGWGSLVVGFLWSTVLLYHWTFAINSLAHVVGNQRYMTGDDSRNSWWLALMTLGEGWHNNHHYYQSSTRQGFRWFEIDLSYGVLKALAWFGVVWDLRAPPRAILEGEQRLPGFVIEKAAMDIVRSFPLDRILARTHTPPAGAAGNAKGRLSVDSVLHGLPSMDDIRRRAREMFSHAPSFDEIAARARQLLIQAVQERLAESPVLGPAV
jgi:stearoyl-CoA desaturase (Delta-9 desaturase)